MANMNLPIEVFDIFDRKFGREDAMALTKSIEAALSLIEDHTRDFAQQRKIEVKEELKVELRSELATKEDIALLRGATKEDIALLRGDTGLAIAKLDKKFTTFWLITMFTMIFLNQDALEFLAKLLGLIK